MVPGSCNKGLNTGRDGTGRDGTGRQVCVQAVFVCASVCVSNKAERHGWKKMKFEVLHINLNLNVLLRI